MNNNALDAGIPLLTEIIDGCEDDLSADDVSADATDTNSWSQSFTREIQTLHRSDESERPALHATRPAATLTDSDREKIAHELHGKILSQLQDRIDFVIEQRVRESLADVLQIAAQGLTEQIKTGLQSTLNDVISSAVAAEIANLQKTKF
ncbi:hypothetical protein [Glaciimonas sp. PAMC28666]|uniref:hypothetical protein n=1 Tax=Glaciimonas sp. PAMC28666 TaxID=2807626 RepID=UPI0019657695|nr:hypothetical protein [Glaciimonas sp. PAMC28666]QRX83604.1 hypothetical protein JQN73_05045 [Glaciimonas sp. PAMC28666]